MLKYDQTFQCGSIQVYSSGPIGSDFVFMHHGAGYTAETWLGFVQEARKLLPTLGFIALDMRGHGRSAKSGPFDLDTLVEDVLQVLASIIKNRPAATNVFLVGHSLGAAVLAASSKTIQTSNEALKVRGLVMIDIIEETAITSLERMPAIIKDIPKEFPSLEMAFKWSTTSSHSHHFPGRPTSELARQSIASQLESSSDGKYRWITDLSVFEPYWHSWFLNLTENFLNFPESRMLIMAGGTEFMDRKMTVAQMQGKFQLIVVRDAGHAIQEDQPQELAEAIALMIQKYLKLLTVLRNK